MKTPQETAREYAKALWNRKSALEWDISRDACESRCERNFLAGARWAEEWISVKDEWPKDEDLILAKDPDGYIDLMQGWQMKERIKPYAVDDFYTAWRPIERNQKGCYRIAIDVNTLPENPYER